MINIYVHIDKSDYSYLYSYSPIFGNPNIFVCVIFFVFKDPKILVFIFALKCQPKFTPICICHKKFYSDIFLFGPENLSLVLYYFQMENKPDPAVIINSQVSGMQVIHSHNLESTQSVINLTNTPKVHSVQLSNRAHCTCNTTRLTVQYTRHTTTLYSAHVTLQPCTVHIKHYSPLKYTTNTTVLPGTDSTIPLFSVQCTLCIQSSIT